MRGKYSPTVSTAYAKDQDWWKRYSGQTDTQWNQYDPDGYDSYGYNNDDMDRAGNYEHEYYCDDEEGDDYWSGTNYKYEHALDVWGFDGVKPVERK